MNGSTVSVAAAGLRMAVGTLCILPVPAPAAVTRTVAGVAMLASPFVAVAIGALPAGLLVLGSAVGSPPLLLGALAVAALAWLTRALHLDGLADTADGLGSAANPERAVQIMRRGDIGPMGVISLVLALVAQVAAIGGLLNALSWRAGLVVLFGVVVSRAALPVACARGVPAARPDGLGLAVAQTVPQWAAAASAVGVAVTVGCAGVLLGAGLPVLVGMAAGASAGAMMAGRCITRFGGVTGDVLGATVEVTFTAYLAAAALVAGV